MHQILFRLGSAQDPAGGDYSSRPEPLAGKSRPTFKGMGWREGGKIGGDRIEEGKGREGRNIEFHHLLLSNLTTG